MNSPSPSPSTGEIEIRRKMVENMTVVEQGIKISWHPHPTICLLRWWVSEWERAPALGENAFWSRVLDCGRETEVSRSTDKISKSLSKRSPLKGKSCHLAREEWFFYSTRQFFREIAISWRNSSILNHESTTVRVNVRVQRKSEKRKGLAKNKMVGTEGKKGLRQCHCSFWSSCDVWHPISYQ